MNKVIKNIFFVLTSLSLAAALWVFKDLLFPFVTSKAFFFRICVEVALPFYVYLLIRVKELRPNMRNPINLLVIIFLLLNFISALVGVNMVRSLFGNFERMGGVYYIAHLSLLYFYVVALGQMGGSYVKRFLQFLLLVALIVTVNGFFGKLGWPTLVPDPSLPGRVSSVLGNPIYLGSFLVIPLFLSLFFGAQGESWLEQGLYYFLGFLFLIGIFLSGTRGALVGLIGGAFISAAVYLLLTTNRKVKLYGFSVVGVLAVVCGFLFLFSSHLPAGSDFQRLFRLRDSNTSARLVQWGVALKGYKDYILFGTGPEDYYIISNKYYNPAIFQYDRSWFDKPHNYLLEILVTDGAFSFIAYMLTMVFLILALYRAYKSGLLSLLEFCILLAGLLVYQGQNLTVFDTVPASLTFYSFLGFAGFIWDAGQKGEQMEKTKNSRGQNPHTGLAVAASLITAVVMVYLVYATNIIPMQIAKAINYGYAYGGVDPKIADSYFQRAMTLPFNFDKEDAAEKYSDFATGFAQSASAADQAFSGQVLQEAANALNQAIAVEPNYPILQERLAAVYLFIGIRQNIVDPRAEAAINQAIALTPGREEAYLTLAQIRSLQGNFPAAEQILNDQIQRFPTDTGVKAQLALTYRVEGKMDQAVATIQQAISEGYTFTSYSDMKWLVDYYMGKKDYNTALDLLHQATKIEPNNVQIYEDLATLYAAAGQTDAARSLAQQIITAEPTAAKAMQALIDSLPGTSTPVTQKKK